MKTKNITLYGAGGHCYAALDLIKSLGEYFAIEIFDNTPKVDSILNIPVCKYKEQPLQTESLCITIGNNRIRKMVSELFQAEYPTFVHNSAIIYPSVTIGKGTLVHPNAVLDSSVSIGDFCIINNSATVSHNVVIEDYAHIAIQTAIAGGVIIGEGTLVGAGSVLLPEIKVGKWAIIGAGSVVTKDVPDNAVVYGNPARIIKFNNEH